LRPWTCGAMLAGQRHGAGRRISVSGKTEVATMVNWKEAERRVLYATRLVTLVAVISSFSGSLLMFWLGLVNTAKAFATQFGDPDGSLPSGDLTVIQLIGALDRMIRRKGLAEPFSKKRGDDYPIFRKALGGIGAEDCHAVVGEFLDALDEARAAAQAQPDSQADSNTNRDDTSAEREISLIDDSIFLEAEAERINEWSTRYAGTDEAPATLAREYLKERKKLEADS
jgi:hypothetical protein